jgi:hypothetical protein
VLSSTNIGHGHGDGNTAEGELSILVGSTTRAEPRDSTRPLAGAAIDDLGLNGIQARPRHADWLFLLIESQRRV